MTPRTHYQILVQCDLWGQRILPPALRNPFAITHLADKPCSQIEEFIMEMVALQHGGCVCFSFLPNARYTVLPQLKPTVLLCDEFDLSQMDSLIVDAIYRQRTRVQQQLWKQYIRHVAPLPLPNA